MVPFDEQISGPSALAVQTARDTLAERGRRGSVHPDGFELDFDARAIRFGLVRATGRFVENAQGVQLVGHLDVAPATKMGQFAGLGLAAMVVVWQSISDGNLWFIPVGWLLVAMVAAAYSFGIYPTAMRQAEDSFRRVVRDVQARVDLQR